MTVIILGKMFGFCKVKIVLYYKIHSTCNVVLRFSNHLNEKEEKEKSQSRFSIWTTGNFRQFLFCKEGS